MAAMTCDSSFGGLVLAPDFEKVTIQSEYRGDGGLLHPPKRS